MDDDRGTSGAVWIGVGIGLGYLAYRILGARSGQGSSQGNDAELTTPSSLPAPRPSNRPPLTPLAPRRRDERPVQVRVRPSSTDPASAVIEVDGRVVSVGELVSRVDAGGRRDVLVTVRGDTRQGAWDEIREALEFAGVQVLTHVPTIHGQPIKP